MRFSTRPVDIGTRSPTVLLNTADVAELGAHPLDRVQITRDGTTDIGIVEVTDELVPPGTLGVTRRLAHVEGPVDVTLAPRPESVGAIKKKLDHVELDAVELRTIVGDIDENRLNDVELSAYVSGVYANGLSREETRDLTEAMTDVGQVIEWDDAVIADKHSIGGVAGNRVTPVVVPIVAAAGIKVPKTSSRAVTSAAGTADTMEVFCDVDFGAAELRDIVEETGACLVWGGSVNLSPVDDKIIRAETPLSVDPPGQIIASVLSKKRSAGSTHAVIDIPYGEGSKVESLSEARELAEDFTWVGEHLGMTVECAITRGDRPIGTGIGPVVEARDVLAVLAGDGPADLRAKAVRLAEVLLEMCGSGADAASILGSGRADEKFREIVAAQGGDPSVEVDDLRAGRETATVRADRDGVVIHANNRSLNEVARRAGAPKDRGAGIVLHRRVGDAVGAGDALFTIHAERAEKLAEAADLAGRSEAMRVRPADEALLERV